MSYELAEAHVADMRAQVWTLTRATFTGAAILAAGEGGLPGNQLPAGMRSAGEQTAVSRLAGSRR